MKDWMLHRNFHWGCFLSVWGAFLFFIYDLEVACLDAFIFWIMTCHNIYLLTITYNMFLKTYHNIFFINKDNNFSYRTESYLKIHLCSEYTPRLIKSLEGVKVLLFVWHAFSFKFFLLDAFGRLVLGNLLTTYMCL